VTLLDDPRAVERGDPSGMLRSALGLAEDLRSGYAAGGAAGPLPTGEGVTAVAVCGMGGSAIAGDVLRALARPRLKIPFDVIRSPELPAYCGPRTLVVCSSYSGDTAETLAAFDEAIRRGCRVVPVTSGGALARRAAAHGLGVVPLPPGLLAPRAAVGHLVGATLGALVAMGLLPEARDDVAETVAELRVLAERLGPGRPSHENPAKDLAHRLRERVPIVWGAEGIPAVAALRWKTNLNENAKVPAFASALPELAHNEVAGWSPGSGRGFFLVALRDEGEHPDVAARVPLSIEIAEEAGAQAEEVWSAGRSPLARLFSLVAMGDLVSVYLALLRGVDPTPIEAIDRLKRALAEAEP
jgi:glucose/mannose-6-phosphate isomerase